MPTRLTIGRLAQAAGVGIETVRFYQRSHLLTEPERPASGYREYSQADVERIRFIKRAQTLGFSLEDIRGLLELDGPQTCKQAHDLALNNLHLVEEKIASLGLIRKALRELIHKCELKQERGDCPIIQSLARSKSESSYC